MARWWVLILGFAAALVVAQRYGVGLPLSEDQVAAYEALPIVRPSGAGLPPGEGDAATGFEIYAFDCAGCHGPNGEGAPFDRLVADAPFSADLPPFRFAVGNYWPYATTLWDYINRAMPYTTPHSLEPDDVYALVAYLLAENGIIDADTVVNQDNLATIAMPARPLYRIDPLTREWFPWIELP